ncbi:hypothetical protein EMPS_11170 [Entomortierella parvispora]|uniref:Uncharacterized protein n=1 Tax=Entomortierella parvispora TaxID=205924 RepID=A0A9P3HLF0_9FUNG|nr:hypothetical protein EMPS_11170 [Entomortierella parvispora]
MVKTDLLKALTDEIPKWPIANKKGTEASARAWIRELGDFWADEGFSFQLYVVRSKLDDPTKSWLAWWRHAVPENEQNWTKLVKDFAQEHVQERTPATTKAEIMRMTQGDKEPSDDYVKRLELKLAMLPKDEDGKYKLSPDEEEMIALQFCTGLHRDHKFKTRNTEPSKTIAETIKNVSKLGEVNRWEDVPDRQRELRDRNWSEETPSQGDNILLGTTSVSRPQFARFKNDFGKEVINNASDIDDLVKLFGAWTITDFTETKPENRVTEAIKRLDVNVARRVLHNTSLSRHVSLANIPPPPAPPIQGNPNSGAAVVLGGSYPPCPECNQMGHGRTRCPRVECRNCGQLGHISYNCPNNRANTTVAQTELNSRAEQDSSRRVRFVNGDETTSTLVTTRATGRTAPVSGTLQRNSADRSSVPTGIGSQRRAETAGVAPPIRRMDVDPEVEQEQPQEGPQMPRKLKIKEIAAMKLRKVRIPVVPDPEIIRQVEELEFDPEIVDKHRGRMAPQLKAAIGAIWTERRNKRKVAKEKRGVTFANRASVQAGDQVTAWIGHHRLDNCIVDPGNEKTMISEHAARQVGLEVRATVNQIRQADGKPISLVGTTGQFTFSVAGTEVEMSRGMNVIDCKRSYDMLLGDDWLKAVRAKGKWTSNAVAYYVTRNGKKVKLGIDPTFESSDDSSSDDSGSEDDDNIYPVFDEDDEVEQGHSLRVQEVQVESNGVIDVVKELSPEQHSEVDVLLECNKDRFTMDLSELEVTDVFEREMNVRPGAKPIYPTGCRQYAPKEKEYTKKNLDEELETSRIIPTESEWCAPLSFAPKEDGNIRKCVAYIGLSKVTERGSWLIRDKTAGSVTTVLFQRVLCRFDMPDTIRTDGGSAFRTEFKTICELSDTQHFVGSTKEAHSQGSVEAMNKQLEERLRLTSRVPQNQLDQYLPQAVPDIDNHVEAATGMSPMQALMGYIGQSALSRHLAQQWQEAAPIAEQLTEDREVMARFACQREGIQEQAYLNRLKANEWTKRYCDLNVRPASFEVGEQVWVYNLSITSGFGRQWTPRWLGPFKVAWVGKAGSYGVRTGGPNYDIINGVEKLNRDMLKRWWEEERIEDVNCQRPGSHLGGVLMARTVRYTLK